MSHSPLTIVITGATGNIGSKLRRHFEDQHRLILLDKDSRGDPDIHVADLSNWNNNGWPMLFNGIDVVVHLAANPNPTQEWSEAQRNCVVDANVLEAAVRFSVPRVIYASSNHVMGGYKDITRPWRLTTDIPPRPGTIAVFDGNPGSSHNYALGKLFGEQLAYTYSRRSEISVIAIRFGWVQIGENLSADMPRDTVEWFRLMWLSNSDLCQLVGQCLLAQFDSTFLIFNGMSANTGMRWDIEPSMRTAGYSPRDDIQREQL